MQQRTNAVIGTIGAALLMISPIAMATSDTPEIGEPAPDLAISEIVQGPADEPPTWKSLEGQVVILEFWATWCAPCIAAIPHLNELAETFADEPVQIIAISNEDAETVAEFLDGREPGMDALVVVDDENTTFDRFNVRGIPYTVIVDAHGKVAGITRPNSVTEEVITDVLAGKAIDVEPIRTMPDLPVAGIDPDAGTDTEPLMQVIVRPTNERGMTVHGGDGFTATGTTVLSLLQSAYNAPRSRFIGVDALPDGYYTVVIKQPHRDGKNMRRLMRLAIETAFDFQVEQEQRLIDVYELALAIPGEHSLEAADEDSFTHTGYLGNGIVATGASLAALVRGLDSMIGAPVFDETGLDGTYNYEFRFDSAEFPDDVTERAEFLDEILREKFGLTLKPAEQAVEMHVIVADEDDEGGNEVVTND